MEFLLLGNIQIIGDDDREVSLSPQQRALLAILLLAPGQRADSRHIMQQLWPRGGESPDALRQCVTGLRKKLGDRVPKSLQRGVVAIQASRKEVDYFRFLDGLDSVNNNQAEAPDRLIETIRAALEEWPCDLAPLGGTGEFGLFTLRNNLSKEHIEATARYLRMLREGKPEWLLDELRRARRRWPDDQELFSLELEYRFDRRQPGARQFYHDWVREHGQPDIGVEELFRRLCHGPIARTAGLPTPRQLPAHRATLVGRAAELAELSDRLIGDDPATLRAVVVTGMPGVGKSQLVQYWADSAAPSFPDGTLYANLAGSGSRGAPEEPSQLLVRLLTNLGVEPSAPTFDGMVTTYRTALSTRRMLVVLDNAANGQQVRPLLPGNGSCSVVVTSRDRLEMLQIQERVHEIWLGPLDRGEAVELLVGDLGTVRIADDYGSLDEIATLCGGLPLALIVVAARLRSRPQESLADVATALRNERTRLDALGHRYDDLDIRSVLSTSYRTLPAVARGMLARLGLHPGPTIGWAAVVDLCGGPDAAVKGEEALAAANLLDQPEVDRRALHDLVRLFATECAEEWTPEDRARAIARIYDYLLHNAHSCDKVLAPDRRVPISAPLGLDVVRPHTVGEAMDWLTAEYATATAALRRAHDQGLDEYTWRIALVLVTYQWRTHRYADAERYLGYAVEAADRSEPPAVRAQLRLALGGSLRGLGQLSRAKAVTVDAVALSEQDGDELGTTQGRQRLALLHREMGEPQAAAGQYQLALDGFRRLRAVSGEAHALAGLADVRLDVGDVAGALEFGEAALILFRDTEDGNGEADTIVGLGRAQARRGDAAQAAVHFGEAAARYREMRYFSREARTLVELAGAQLSGLEVVAARKSLRRANEIYLDLGDTYGAATAEARIRMLDA